MRNRSKLSGLTRSTMFLLLAAVTLLPLSGCGAGIHIFAAGGGLIQGEEEENKGNIEKANKHYVWVMREVRAYAEEGRADAQVIVGKLYFGGKGVPQNSTEAIKWFQKAADQGDREAVALLAEATEKQKAEEAKKIVAQRAAETQKVQVQQEGKIREQQEAEEKKAQAKRAEIAKNIIKQKITVGRLQWAKRGTPKTIGELSIKQQPWVKLHSVGVLMTKGITIAETGVKEFDCFASDLTPPSDRRSRMEELGPEPEFISSFLDTEYTEEHNDPWEGGVKWARIECLSEHDRHSSRPDFQYTFIVMPNLGPLKDLSSASLIFRDAFHSLISPPQLDVNYGIEHQAAWSKLVAPYVPPLTIASIIHTASVQLSIDEIEKRLDEKFAGMHKGIKIEKRNGFAITYITYGEKGNGGVEVMVSPLLTCSGGAGEYCEETDRRPAPGNTVLISERIDFEQPIAVAEAQWNLIEAEVFATARAKEKGKF